MPEIGSVGPQRPSTSTVTITEKPTAGVISIVNTDGSLIISPNTGNVTASLNVANPNTWTATQTFTQVPQTSQSGSTSNTGYGTGALAANTGNNYNTAIGYQALANNTAGSNNVAIGYQALVDNTTGGSNTAIGYQALMNNTTEGGNVAIGYQVLLNNTGGFFNIAIGAEALLNSNGIENIAIGVLAGNGLTTGSSNVLIGFEAATSLTTGNQNVVLGYQSNALPATSSNALNIANYIFGTGLTGTGTTLSPSTANIGIGIINPTATLHVVGTGLYTGALTTNSTFTASGLITANGGITMAGTSTINTGVTLTNDGLISNAETFNNTGTFNNVSGGTFTSAGTMTITGGSTYSGSSSTLTLAPTGTATSTQVFPSNTLEFQASYWNGTSAVTISDNLIFNSNDTPITFVFPWPNSEVVFNTNLFIAQSNTYVPNNTFIAEFGGTNVTATAASILTITTLSSPGVSTLALTVNGINLSIAGHYETGGGGTAPTSVTVPASGTAYTASTLYNTILTVSGGAVSNIAINGVNTGLTSGTFYLKANDTITFTYTTAPTVFQMFA